MDAVTLDKARAAAAAVLPAYGVLAAYAHGSRVSGDFRPDSDLDVGYYLPMARFRNRLVHLYWEVNDVLVAEYLQSSVRDLEGFARAIASKVDLPDRTE